MEIVIKPQQKTTMDVMRKRCLAAVCQYLEKVQNSDFLKKDSLGRINYAKGMVCRAAKVETGSFNKIGRVRLRAMTNAFNKLSRDMDGVLEEAYKSLN